MRKQMALLLACLLFLCCSFAHADGIAYYHGDLERPQIAITVDDCYNQKHMEAILDLCEEYDIPVTFFLVGSAINAEWKSTYERAIALGCELGNHTLGHASLPKLSDSLIKKQLHDVETALDNVLGYHYEMKAMRPPYGNIEISEGRTIAKSVKAAGYQIMAMWNVSQTDPVKAIRKVQNGCIMLFHTLAKDVTCLEIIIPQILELGFEPVTISRLVELQTGSVTVSTATPDPITTDKPDSTITESPMEPAVTPTATPALTATPVSTATLVPTETSRIVHVTVKKSSSR